MALVAVVNIAFSNNPYTPIAATQSFETIFLWLVLMSIAIYIPIDDAKLRVTLLIFFGFSFLFLIQFVIETGSLMYFPALLFSSEEAVASYQGFARSALIVSFFLIATSVSLGGRAFLFFAGAFVLFVLGARSEFFAFLSSVIVFELLRSRLSINYLLFWVVFVVGFSFASTLFWGDFVDSRHGQVLDLASSSSWALRTEALNMSVQEISENAIFGSFGSHILPGGEAGLYAHNIFSAWQNYGLLGFLLVLILSTWATVGSIAAIRRTNGRVAISNYSFLLNFCVLILLLISKSIFWVVPGLAWGLYVAIELRSSEALRSG